MTMLKTLTVATLVIAAASVAQASYHEKKGDTQGGGMAASDGGMAMGAPAVTGKVGDRLFLMDAHKMTLYTFDNDSPGLSSCYGGCAQNWPPLLAPARTSLGKGYSLIARTDGTMQVAYKKQPLYLWVQDMQPGQMSGDGVGGVWHIARP